MTHYPLYVRNDNSKKIAVKMSQKINFMISKTVNYARFTYVYHGASAPTGACRPAPVKPEHGINFTSFAGLNPTFFKYGVKLSLQ